MQGVPLQFSDEKDRARFRHLEQLPGVELYHAHISRYAFEPHTHEAFGIGVIEQGAERFRYRGSQHIAAANSIVTMNPDELHTGEAETADGWRYRMIYLEPDRLEAITGVRDWWFSEVVREDPLRSRQIGQLIYGLWHSDDPLAQQGMLLDLIDTFRPLAHHASAQGEAGHRFDRVRDYLHGIVQLARKSGYTETILGRRRYLPDLGSSNRQRREMAERMALNAPIQGSAADIIKVAMLDVESGIAREGLRSRMVLQVHDELVFEVAPGEAAQLTALVRDRMGHAVDLDVPLDVSVGIGPSWHAAAH